MFVRIRLPMGQPYPGLLVIDRAVTSDQGLKYVYVVGADGKAEYRRITTGALQEDGLREIAYGQRVTLGRLLSVINQHKGKDIRLASALRIFVARHYRGEP